MVLSNNLKPFHFDIIISSDLIRAVRTAEIIASNLHLNCLIDKRLRERSFGKYEGTQVDELLKLYTKWDKLTAEEKFSFKLDENEESFAEGYKRFSEALQDIANQYPDKTVLVITHGGMIRGFLIKNGYGDFDKIGSIENCGYIKVGYDGKKYIVMQVKGLKKWAEK